MIRINEIFHSLQGEGLYVGQPSVFIRTFGCNFRCPKFGLNLKEKNTEIEEIINIHKNTPYLSISDMPTISSGCDSYFSIYPKFKNLSPKMDIPDIVHEVNQQIKVLPGKENALKSNHIVITGGEPLLGWQKQYPELLDKLAEAGYRSITFETNGTQEICDELHDYLMLNYISGKRLDITFSVSPKLPCSGESINDALQPEIVDSYQQFGQVYLKFVVSNKSDMNNVNQFVKAYREAGFEGEVYLMPCGGDPVMYNLNAPEVAKSAMEYGYKYSPRLQVDLFQNRWGT